MNIKKLLAFTLVLVGWSTSSYADKVSDAKKAINAAPGCESKALSDSDALRYVKELYIKCDKGATVDIEGCKVACQK